MSELPIDNRGPRHWGEDIFIILSIASLWPTIIGWNHPVYEFLLYVALISLVVIFVRRVRRFRKSREELHGD